MTGLDLRHYRVAAGLSQRALAERAGLHRNTIRYWEDASEVDSRCYGPTRMIAALGLKMTNYGTSTRRRARPDHGLLDRRDDWLGGLMARVDAQIADRAAGKAARRREHRIRRCAFRNGATMCERPDCLGRDCARLVKIGLDDKRMPLRRRRRPKCAARTRKGTPCQMRIEPGKRRCRLHGGLSTGPKTQEGRERIAEAQRRRWNRWSVDNV